MKRPRWDHLPGVVLAEQTAELGDAVLGAVLRAEPPAGVSRAAVAALVEARDPQRAFALYADDGSAAARAAAGRVGAWLLEDRADHELPAHRVLEIAERMERDGLWRSPQERFAGHLARAWTYFEFRDPKAPGLRDALAVLDALAAARGDPVSAARARLIAMAAIPVPAPRDVAEVDALVAVLLRSGDEAIRFEGEFVRTFALWHHTLHQAAWRRFMREVETFDLGRVPLRLLACALAYVVTFLTTTEQVTAGRRFASKAHAEIPPWATRARNGLAVIDAELEAAAGRYAVAYARLGALARRLYRPAQPWTWNMTYSNARTCAALAGEVVDASRHARALIAVFRDQPVRASSTRSVLAEFERLRGRCSSALRLLDQATHLGAEGALFVAVKRLLVNGDLGVLEVDVPHQEHPTPQVRCFARFTCARSLLRQGRLEEACGAAARALEVPIEPTEDLYYNALTVAARVAVALWQRDRDEAQRAQARAWLARISDAGRWYSVRRVLLGRLEDDAARAEAWLREALRFGLESGMLPFALEASVALAERFGGEAHEERCRRLAGAIADDLEPEHRHTFLANWRTICA